MLLLVPVRQRMIEEPCGCRWTYRGNGMVTAIMFDHRCGAHAVTCRDLEDWELEALSVRVPDVPDSSRLDISEMNWCGFCLIPVPSGQEPPHKPNCPTL